MNNNDMKTEEIKQGYEDSVSKEEQSVEGYIEYLEKYVVQLSKTNEGILKRIQSQPAQLSLEEATRLADAKYFNDEQEKAEADEETLREHGVFIKGVIEVNSPLHLFVNKEYLTQRNQQEKG